MLSFIATTLLVGAAFALPAPQETETVYDTEVFTITSCGPEVTNWCAVPGVTIERAVLTAL